MGMSHSAKHELTLARDAVRLRPWALFFLLAALTGCGTAGTGGESIMCTAIGSESGIGISVDPAMAEKTGSEAHVTVRWGQRTYTSTARLSPSSVAGKETCTGNQPDSSCSTKLVPTGGKDGFATIPELPTAPLQVKVAIPAKDGKPVVDDALRVTAQVTYPNGRKCPAGGTQGQLVVDAKGHLGKAPSGSAN